MRLREPCRYAWRGWSVPTSQAPAGPPPPKAQLEACRNAHPQDVLHARKGAHQRQVHICGCAARHTRSRVSGACGQLKEPQASRPMRMRPPWQPGLCSRPCAQAAAVHAGLTALGRLTAIRVAIDLLFEELVLWQVTLAEVKLHLRAAVHCTHQQQQMQRGLRRARAPCIDLRRLCTAAGGAAQRTCFKMRFFLSSSNTVAPSAMASG